MSTTTCFCQEIRKRIFSWKKHLIKSYGKNLRSQYLEFIWSSYLELWLRAFCLTRVKHKLIYSKSHGQTVYKHLVWPCLYRKWRWCPGYREVQAGLGIHCCYMFHCALARFCLLETVYFRKTIKDIRCPQSCDHILFISNSQQNKKKISQASSTCLVSFLSCRNPWDKLPILTLVLLNPEMSCLCKECRSRSVGFWRSQLIWICTVWH